MPVAPRSPLYLGNGLHRHVVDGDGTHHTRNASASVIPRDSTASSTGQRSTQPTQRTSGSFRALGAGTVFGWPTMIGATVTHGAGMPSACFPSGVFR